MTEHRINLSTLARIKDNSGHSIYGPSSSHMYLHCAGSLIPNLLAKDTAGDDAAYGTVAHGVTEQWLKSGHRPDHLVGTNEFVPSGKWGFLIDIDDEMLDYAQQCVDWVEFLPGVHYIERRVDFSRLTPIPNQRGTADFIAIDDERMVVADWKFGKGVRVYAEDNSQGMLYALGALFEFDSRYNGRHRIKEIEIRIGQPRMDNFDVWVISAEDLIKWGEWAKERMAEAWVINAPRTPGTSQCRFCRVNIDCAAYAKLLVDMTEGVFENLEQSVSEQDMIAFKERIEDLDFSPNFADVGKLTTEHLELLMPYRTTAEGWWNRVDNELMRRIAAGERLKGHKIVEGRSRRAFNDKDKAVQMLTENKVPYDKAVVSELVSPAVAEKLLREVGLKTKVLPSLFEGLIYKPPGKPTLVPLHDKRPEIAPSDDGVFTDVESETDEPEGI